MRRSFANVVLSIARGLCLRDASILLFAAYFALSMPIMGCGSGGSTGGGTQQSTQTITFTAPASPVTYTPTLSITLSATGGGSGNAVVFSIDSSSTSKGTVTGNTVTGITAGKLVIDANQAGNTSYYAADQVQQTVVVNPATPTVSVWPSPTAITAGAALSTSTLSGGSASVAGVFAWTAPTTVPAAGTDSESVTFTPTDNTDYTTVSADVQIVVNPATPQITAFTPRYAVADDLKATVNHTITCSGCVQGDTLHDATGIFADLTWPSSSATQTYGDLWQEGNFQPTWDTQEIQHPNGAYGNQWSYAFLGSASQSTLAVSPTSGTLFQDEQASGQVYWQKSDGTTGPLLGGTGTAAAQTPTNIAIDDVSGNLAYSFANSKDVAVFSEAGTRICDLTLNMSFVSSIAARGGYMVFTDPVDNLVGIAKMDCSGYQTLSVAGQPWSVAMTNNGSEVDAYVLFRDAWKDEHPGVVKFVAPAMTVAGSVELTNIPSVSSIRATTPLEGVYQIVAFTNSPMAAVLFMSDETDGQVALVSTNTSGSNVMKVTSTVQVPELPFALATQETASASTLWVAYIKAMGGDNVTHAGTIDPATGNYTPAVGTCPTGILAGGFAATSSQVYCAQGSKIVPLQLAQ